MDGKIGPPARRHLKCARKIITIFTVFGQNTAEFYDNHILLTMTCIFFQNLGLNGIT